jgi:hypothetical protein
VFRDEDDRAAAYEFMAEADAGMEEE